MTVETQYNVVKVNELREITVAQGVDELVINDLDSNPLETKKITAENFALSIKDYVLPIASDTLLGGVKIGDGLTINPITGVLSNDVLILDDLDDVIILNAAPGDVLRYNGVQWINQPEGGLTEIVAGQGLSGGGSEGIVTLHVNAGPGLTIYQDAVAVNVRKGLQIIDDYIETKLAPGLTISGNAITPVTGAGIVIDQSQFTLRLGSGLEFAGLDVRVNLNEKGLAFNQGEVALVTGKGLEFNNNKLEALIGHGLEFVSTTADDAAISAVHMSYTEEGVAKFAPIVQTIDELRGTPSYSEDTVNPEFLDKVGIVPTGAVFHFAGPAAPPGYLFCDGREVQQATYPALFAVIGNFYNQGGAVTPGTFRLPDLRDEFIRGATSLGAPEGGSAFRDRRIGQTESDQVKKHTHELDMGEISASVVTPGAFPTTNTSGFVWGFTMNNCSPPHFFDANSGEYQIGDGDHYYNFENGQFQQNTLNTADAGDAVPFYEEPEIPPGCSRVEFPVRIETTPSSIQVYPSAPTPDNDVDETRPRNMALLPCIKY